MITQDFGSILETTLLYYFHTHSMLFNLLLYINTTYATAMVIIFVNIIS